MAFQPETGWQKSTKIQELIQRKWILLRVPLFSSKIPRNKYVLWSASFQKAREHCPKPMKLRAGISPHLLAVVHKVDFHLGWDFFSRMISLMEVMVLVAKDAALLFTLVLWRNNYVAVWCSKGVWSSKGAFRYRRYGLMFCKLENTTVIE